MALAITFRKLFSSWNLPINVFSRIMKEPFLKSIQVHETVEFHRAFGVIMEISKGKKCDLIVMGSHGSSGIEEIFIGSNTEKVVRHSEIPVLVIKNDIPEKVEADLLGIGTHGRKGIAHFFSGSIKKT